MKHTNKLEDIIGRKPMALPNFSIISTEGLDPVEISCNDIVNFSINNNGESMYIETLIFKRIISSVENDTFKITTSQCYTDANNEGVMLERDYSNMVLTGYSTSGYGEKTTFTYYFQRADMVQKMDEE